MNTSLRESFLLLSLSLLFFSSFSSLYYYYQAVAAGVQSSFSLSCNLSLLFSLERTLTFSFTDEIGPLSIIVPSLPPSPVVTILSTPAQANSAALPPLSVVIAPALTENIIVVVFSTPAEFTFSLTQEHKLCLPVKEHDISLQSASSQAWIKNITTAYTFHYLHPSLL
ncbi:uncharacterized protein CIMG_12710 [Coccidioides immitis RS]|uniref:Uncharacterized protein n=1 Tax=Coccidioides immitis (strain RS) TaxID=246410 RepID=A0A0E1S0Q7_COCIM|nr:uncharacterized protein CIMG_12710 [Coccidioides immitis RS]EAS36883.2 hypothetical protein CIMG_12710 [Coccidioides immitis RS]